MGDWTDISTRTRKHRFLSNRHNQAHRVSPGTIHLHRLVTLTATSKLQTPHFQKKKRFSQNANRRLTEWEREREKNEGNTLLTFTFLQNTAMSRSDQMGVSFGKKPQQIVVGFWLYTTLSRLISFCLKLKTFVFFVFRVKIQFWISAERCFGRKERFDLSLWVDVCRWWLIYAPNIE